MGACNCACVWLCAHCVCVCDCVYNCVHVYLCVYVFKGVNICVLKSLNHCNGLHQAVFLKTTAVEGSCLCPQTSAVQRRQGILEK